MGKNSAVREARRARQEEKERESRISSGSVDIRDMFDKMFNAQYYQDVQKQVTDHYQPEIDSDFEKARRKLQIAMTRRGLDNSTTFANKFGELGELKGKQEQNVIERGKAEATARRGNILNAEDTVLGQLRSSGDLNAANAAAANQLAFQNQPPVYSPLGSIFTDFTAGLATQAEQERQGTNRYNLGISRVGDNMRRYFTNIGGKT